jgi:tripartite-type tricarboxylate transporter receptor subunit TctC
VSRTFYTKKLKEVLHMINKFIKKAAVISLLAVSLAACGNQNNNSNNGNTAASASPEGTEQTAVQTAAAATDFPTKPVTVIVPFAAGGTIDLAVRAFAKGFQDETGQALVVENKAGGAGVPGTINLVNATNDGYTIAALPSGQLSLRPAMQKVDYEFPGSFTPILGVGDFEMVIVASSKAKYKTVAEMAEQSKETKTDIKVATSGVNTYGHLLAAMISKETGLTYRHLPFEGNAEAVTAVLGNNSDIAIVNMADAYQQIKAGNLQVLGVPSAERYANYNEASTLKEQNINVVGGTTFAIYGPAGLPQDIVTKLQDVFTKAMDSETFKTFTVNANLVTTKSTPEDLIKEIEADRANIDNIKADLQK